MELFTFALLQQTLAFVALLLQCLTLPVFFLFADYRSRVSYHMMLSIGLFDLLQLLPMLILNTAFVCGAQMPTWIDRICAALNIVGLDALILEHLLLALNRAVTIIRPFFRPSSKESERERALFLTLNLVLWLVFLCALALFQTPLLGAKFQTDIALFYFDFSLPFSEFYRMFEFYLTIAVPGLSFCLYLAILAILRKSRNLSQPTAASAVGTAFPPPPLINAQERRLLLQSGALFAGMLAIIVTWFLNDRFGQLTNQLCTFFYICYCGSNPVLYLTMNPEFRHRFLCVYRLRKPANVVHNGNHNMVVVVKSKSRNGASNK